MLVESIQERQTPSCSDLLKEHAGGGLETPADVTFSPPTPYPFLTNSSSHQINKEGYVEQSRHMQTYNSG